MPQVAGLAQQLDAEPARLREERDVARRPGCVGRERRVQAHRRVGVQRRRGSSGRPSRMPFAARRRRRSRARRACRRRPISAKPAEMITQPVHALLRALVDDAGHLGGGHDDDREVDRAGDVEHGRIRRDAGDRRRVVGLHRVHGPSKPCRAGSGTLRCRSCPARGSRRSPRPCGARAAAPSTPPPPACSRLDDADRRLRRLDREAGPHRAAVEAALARPAGRREDVRASWRCRAACRRRTC